MLLQSNIFRPKGTIVEFDGPRGPRSIHYHFKAQANDEGAPHLCDVTDEEHIEILLAVPGRAFSLHKRAKVDAVAPVAPVITAPAMSVIAALPPVPTPEPVVTPAPAQQTTEPVAPVAIEGIDALRAEYTRLYGQPPHPATKADTLRARIAAFQAAS